MTSLVHKLGLSSGLSWHDVYSLDDPSLLAFVPRPAHALLLVFPTSAAYEKARYEEDKPLSGYCGTGPEEEVLWFRQTIGNACGLMGLLHAACNGMTRDLIGSLISPTVSPQIPSNYYVERPRLLFLNSSPKLFHSIHYLAQSFSRHPIASRLLMPQQPPRVIQ